MGDGRSRQHRMEAYVIASHQDYAGISLVDAGVGEDGKSGRTGTRVRCSKSLSM
jgi:hypothetical protein